MSGLVVVLVLMGVEAEELAVLISKGVVEAERTRMEEEVEEPLERMRMRGAEEEAVVLEVMTRTEVVVLCSMAFGMLAVGWAVFCLLVEEASASLRYLALRLSTSWTLVASCVSTLI